MNIVCYNINVLKVNFIIIPVNMLTTNTACTLFRCATVLWLISVPILLPSSPKWSLNFKLDSYSSFCMNVWQLHTSGAVSQHSLRFYSLLLLSLLSFPLSLLLQVITVYKNEARMRFSQKYVYEFCRNKYMNQFVDTNTICINQEEILFN